MSEWYEIVREEQFDHPIEYVTVKLTVDQLRCVTFALEARYPDAATTAGSFTNRMIELRKEVQRG